MTLRIIAAAALIAAAINLAVTPHVHASDRFFRFHRDIGHNGLKKGYVVARSRFGNGSVSGPVRMTDLGPQVRLPGGTWEYCRRVASASKSAGEARPACGHCNISTTSPPTSKARAQTSHPRRRAV